MINYRTIARLATAILLSVVALMATGCKTVDTEKEKAALMATDREFSDLSVRSGTPVAFATFMTDDATVFRNQAHPYEGRTAISEILTRTASGTLRWEPYFVDVAISGDIGYTLGRWVFTDADSTGQEYTGYGNYVTVWKKQADGSWKFVFDTGTTSPPPES